MSGVENPQRQPLSLDVNLAHAFGSRCTEKLRDAALFGDEIGDVLLQPLARHLSFQHLATGEMTFAGDNPIVELITACCVSRGRDYIGICERCSETPLTQVSIFDMTSSASEPVQVLQEFGGRVGHLVSAAFSEDGDATRLCLTSVEPELLLTVIDWRQNIVLGKCSLACAADRVAFSPLDTTVISASGASFLGAWRVLGSVDTAEGGAVAGAGAGAGATAATAAAAQAAVSGSIELQPFREGSGLQERASVFTDHVWLRPGDGTLAACTAEGPVHLISAISSSSSRRSSRGSSSGSSSSEHGVAEEHAGVDSLRLLRTIANPFQGKLAGAAPLCIRSFASGCVLGGSHGAVAVWERRTEAGSDSAELQHVATVLTSQTEFAVHCIDVSGETGGELRVLLGFRGADIAHTTLETLREADGATAAVSVVAGGFHSGPITSLDVAVQRPIIVSASQKDCSVRIWNYAVGRCELLKDFPNEELSSVAIHPLGYFLAVSFSDKLRFMQILVNELKLHRELSIRGVRLVRFANGGHLLAAAQGKLVLVFSARNLTKVATLRGHSQPVSSLCFDAEDRTLTTCAEDGSLCEWSTQCWTKLHDSSARLFEPQAIALAVGSGGLSFAGLSEAGRTVLRSHQHCVPVEDEELPLPGQVQVSALVHQAGPHFGALFAGTSDGSLRSYCLLASAPICSQLRLHRGACSAVCISGDACTLVTAGDDGILFVLRLSGLAPELLGGAGPVGPGLRARRGETGPGGEVVMILRGEILARLEETEALSLEARQLKVQIVEDAARMESECVEQLARAQQSDQEEIQALRLHYESMQQAATAKERENLRSMKAMEASHVQAADQLEQVYDRQVRHESERFAKLEDELKQLQTCLDKLQADSRQRMEQQQERQGREFSRCIQEKDAEIQRLKDLAAFSQHRFDVMLDQEGMEHDFECAELNRQHQEELEQQRLVEYRRKKEQDSLVRGLDTLERDRERIRKEQEENKSLENNLRLEAEGLQRAVAGLKAERRDHESLLRDRELEISNYKQKASTLKKFRHVLDFRLREVAQTLQPKDQMIQQLHEQLGELEAELEQQLSAQRQMELTLEQKKQQAVAMAREAERLREIVKQRERSIFRFTEDLYALATKEQDTRLWPQGIRKIYRDHVDPKHVSKDTGSLGMQELGRQVQTLQHKANCLVAKGKYTENTTQSDINKKMEDNNDLIKEADDLRLEKRGLEAQLKELEFQIGRVEKRLASGRGHSTPALASGAREALPARDAPPTSALALSTTATPGRVRSASGSQGALAAARRRAKVPHKTLEERSQLKKLLAAADRGGQQVQLQAIESKLLRDHLHKLQARGPGLGEAGVESAS